MIETQADAAVSAMIDRLVTIAQAELGPGVEVVRTEDGVRLMGPRLSIRRLADVRLRDLIGTAVNDR